MKKLFIIAILSCNFLNAQNVFPTTGNVGIGTTSPTEKLEVSGGNIFLNSAAGQFIRWSGAGIAPPSFINTSAGTKLLLYPQVGSTEADYAIGIDHFTLWQGVPGNNANYSHKFYAGTTPLMTIRGDGNVGIGTTTPLQRLHINGSQFIENGSLSVGISAPTNTFTNLQVHNGAMMVSGANGAGGPMICFSDNIAPTAYPNGRWGIEYMPNKGLNFWKPWNPDTGGGGNYYMLLKDSGKVGIGTENTPSTIGNSNISPYLLYVKGGILTDQLRVATGWADYVFEDNYVLRPLSEVESFINANGHLPNVPSARQVEIEGISVGEMAKIQQEKIEELTLYIIQLNKKIEQQNKKIEILESKLK